jgi:hypothetical protein
MKESTEMKLEKDRKMKGKVGKETRKMKLKKVI